MNQPLQPHSAFTLMPSVADGVSKWSIRTSRGVQDGWGRTCEKPGAPVFLVLHGGPGSGASSSLLAPFEGVAANIWAPNQRACLPQTGRTLNRLSVAGMVADLEALRVALGVTRWSVWGGSWGSYLALAYWRANPSAVQALVLRGSFLGGRGDIWGLVRRLPVRQLARAGLPLPSSALHLPAWLACAKQLFQYGTHGATRSVLALAWGQAESELAWRGAQRACRSSDLLGQAKAAQQAVLTRLSRSKRLAKAALLMRRSPSPALLRKVQIQTRLLPSLLAHPLGRIAKTQPLPRPPLHLVHGRFDAVCAPAQSRRLAQSWQGSGTEFSQWSWQVCEAGHLGHEPAIRQALTRAVKRVLAL